MYLTSPDHWTFSNARGFDAAQFVEVCVRRVNQHVGCSRTGLWVFDEVDGGRALRCLGIFDRAKDRIVQAPPETERAAGLYFAALVHEGRVVANDARTHPATRAFFDEKLQQSGVQSLMACAFSLNGSLFGAFTCTQTDHPVTWSRRQLTVLTKISSHATLALAHAGSGAIGALLERRRQALPAL